MAFAQDIRHANIGITNRFEKIASKVKLAARRRAAYNQTFGELAALNDRDLQDLGISRSDIRAIASSAADLI